MRTHASSFLAALVLCYATTALVIAGAAFGMAFVPPLEGNSAEADGIFVRLANWDGEQYARINRDGYYYSADIPSTVGFFPAFPILGRAVSRATGFSPQAALVVVSNVALVAAFLTFACYLAHRFPGDAATQGCALLWLAVFPTTCFFRFAYTESLFALVCCLCLLAIERARALLWIGLLAGAATAIRPVGVALLFPVIAACWERSSSARSFAVRVIFLAPLAIWGLLAFMAFQYAEFGDAAAFATAQSQWRLRPAESPATVILALTTLEPLWSVYVPSSPAFWQRHDLQNHFLFSLQAFNPLYFLLAAVLIAAGIRYRWLNKNEAMFAIAAIAIPYFTRSFDMCMGSCGRYVAVALPIYIVLGRMSAGLPRVVVFVGLIVSVFFLVIYSALFAAHYFII